jgi:hypothetical protein
LIIGTFLLITFIKNKEKEVKKSDLSSNCPDKELIGQQEAFDDFTLEKEDEQLGLMFCYCKQQFFKAFRTLDASTYEVMQQTFPDEQKHCEGFVLRYIGNQVNIFSVPLAIVGINILIRTVLKYLAKYERQWNLTDQKLD